MVFTISYFIIFGIINYTNGNPAYRQDSDNEEPQYSLRTMREELPKQSKYDVMLNYYEDRPENHHEDTTKITYNGDKTNNHFYNDKYRNAELYQGVRGKNSNYNNQPSIHDDDTETINYSENDNDVYLKPKNVLKYLNDLDKTLKLDEKNDIELRCYGNGCGVNRVDDYRSNSDRDVSGDRDYNYNNINENYNRHLRCNGKRCSIDRDNDDKNYGDNLRCYGNTCRKTNDRDDDYSDVRNNEDGFYNDINYILRSNKDGGDRNGINSFRCIGDRCSQNRNDDDRRDTLLCIGNRCSRNRGNDRVDSDNNRDDSRYEARNDRYDDRDVRDGLRCVGVRCGRNGDDNERYCNGNSCGRSRPHEKNKSKAKSKAEADANTVLETMLKINKHSYMEQFKKSQGIVRSGVLEIIQMLLH